MSPSRRSRWPVRRSSAFATPSRSRRCPRRMLASRAIAGILGRARVLSVRVGQSRAARRQPPLARRRLAARARRAGAVYRGCLRRRCAAAGARLPGGGCALPARRVGARVRPRRRLAPVRGGKAALVASDGVAGRHRNLAAVRVRALPAALSVAAPSPPALGRLRERLAGEARIGHAGGGHPVAEPAPATPR